MKSFPLVPASFFGIVLGVAGLGNAWRVSARLWDTPAWIGESILALAALIWIVVAIFYAGKWIGAREQALAEFRHPVQCCFVGLGGVATLLIAVAAIPYSVPLAWCLFALGVAAQLGFATYRTGSLWQGGRDHAATTPVLYLPMVAGNFVAATALGALGQPSWAALLFGGGLFTWFAIESVLLHRLYVHDSLPPPLRPTLGIQLAPPVVGASAWLSINGGSPDLFAQALLGYGLLQALILIRLAPWIRQQPFGASYWAFSFGVTALPLAAMRMLEHGAAGAVAELALPLFAAANLFIAGLAVGTLVLLLRGRLLPPALPIAVPAR
ncbi:MAG TPA: dicarboxylate transporter/tellurite-resistance protein TehA [Dokdonella sp.]